MNILYINHYAGSPSLGMEYRPYYLAKEWLKFGHSVRIAASAFSHARAIQPTDSGAKIKKRIQQTVEGVDYVWYPTPMYDGNGILRVKNILSFLWQVWTDKELTKNFRPDIVIASSTYPMDIWVAHSIAKKHKAKLVFEVHDLWPLSPIELGGMSPSHPFIIMCQAAENYAYKHSDVVVSMLPKVHEYMSKKGLDLDKLYIVPNGIVEDDWSSESESKLEESSLKDFLMEQKNKGKTIVGYAGSHGKPNALNYFLDAAKLIQNENNNIVFVSVGSGLEKDNLIAYMISEEITNFHFFDPIPKKQIPDLLSYFDIAYIGWNVTPIYRFGIAPNKLMDYMMAGKVILHSVDAGNDPVSESGCGITVAPENPARIAEGLLQLARLTDLEKVSMGSYGKQFVLNNHTYSVLGQNFLKAMQL